MNIEEAKKIMIEAKTTHASVDVKVKQAELIVNSNIDKNIHLREIEEKVNEFYGAEKGYYELIVG